MNEIVIPFDWGRHRKGAPVPETEVAPLFPARIARQLALAHALQRRLDAGEFHDQADMARALGFTRARASQLLDLLLLAPDIQEEILYLECPAGAQPLHEAQLRPIVRPALWPEQRRRWRTLVPPDMLSQPFPADRPQLAVEAEVAGSYRALTSAGRLGL